eukprot:scaffold37429_cov60-Phaeocystis_antarctica.AAC.6
MHNVHCVCRLGARLACGDHLAAEMAAKAAKGKRYGHPRPHPHPQLDQRRAPPAHPPLPRLPVSSGGCGSRESLEPKPPPSPPPPPPRLGRRVGGYGLRFLLLLVVVFLLYCGLGVAYRHACALIVNCMCTGFAPHVH